ncbi:hypothetical protein [Dipodfec virus RodF1_63]|uniref:Uncharacterized protein n=1 Tax=Dipodfec virus RodF1_63 TaxID=2929305 RepID=A0A976R8D3_9VIRU|nr:hypothetical protein [Dipodfec virus RodF1_63]
MKFPFSFEKDLEKFLLRPPRKPINVFIRLVFCLLFIGYVFCKGVELL